jgi:hypothetical protein
MAKPTFGKFRGLDNKNQPEKLTSLTNHEAWLTQAENVDISAKFSISRRNGFQLKVGGDFHSLWTNAAGTLSFAVKDRELVRISADLAITALLTMSHRLVSYADTGAGIYLTDNNVMVRTDGFTAVELAQAGTYDFKTKTSINQEDDQDFYSSPPPGKLVVWAFGRLWVVTDDAIYYSRPYEPNLFDLRKDYWPLENVTMLASVDDGFYIGTDSQVMFYASGNPNEPASMKVVSNAGAIYRAVVEADARDFGLKDVTGKAVVWESQNGKCLGLNAGQVLELTTGHVSYDAGELGAMFLREQNGQRHVVSTVASSGEGSNMRATDKASAVVIRNGIVLA